jgi:pSer/pThr/pTyr-binding forkhead associated (FHA) protein
MMLKQIYLAAIGVAVLTGVCAGSNPAIAMLATNGRSLNGISSNGISTNGLTINGQRLSSTTTLQAVRIVLPNGTELTFR